MRSSGCIIGFLGSSCCRPIIMVQGSPRLLVVFIAYRVAINEENIWRASQQLGLETNKKSSYQLPTNHLGLMLEVSARYIIFVI